MYLTADRPQLRQGTFRGVTAHVAKVSWCYRKVFHNDPGQDLSKEQSRHVTRLNPQISARSRPLYQWDGP